MFSPFTPSTSAAARLAVPMHAMLSFSFGDLESRAAELAPHASRERGDTDPRDLQEITTMAG